MKVFNNTEIEGWGGGMILIAANSPKEAFDVYVHSDIYDDFWPDEGYTFSGFQEMPMLTANVDKPQILAEKHYQE